MTKQTINIGASPNDGTGDPLRTAFDKTNDNFTELYTSVGLLQPADADLTAIAALSGTTGFLKKTNLNTWALDTNSYLTSINSSSVISALGFTPYNASNPNNYITSLALTDVNNTLINHGHDITILQNVNTTQNTNITAINSFAQGAYNKANSANVLAQAAFNVANTLLPSAGIDSYARTTANVATSNIIIIQGVDTTQNTNIAIANNAAQAAFSKTNTTTILAQAAFDAANTATSSSGVDSFARTTANTATSNITIIQGVDIGQNTRMSIIEGVNTTQNTNVTIANNAGQAAFAQANATAGGLISANARITIVEGVNTTQNTNITAASSSITYLQGALNSANTNIAAAAQTIPQNARTTDYVLQLTDAGKHIHYTQSIGTILYVPNEGQLSFPTGASIMIISQTTSGASVTVTPNTGVSLYLASNTTSDSRAVTSYGMATLIKVSANTWFINGTGVI